MRALEGVLKEDEGSLRRGGSDSREQVARAVRRALREREEPRPGARDGAVAVVARAVTLLQGSGGREGDEGEGDGEELHLGGCSRRTDFLGQVAFYTRDTR